MKIVGHTLYKVDCVITKTKNVTYNDIIVEERTINIALQECGRRFGPSNHLMHLLTPFVFVVVYNTTHEVNHSLFAQSQLLVYSKAC